MTQQIICFGETLWDMLPSGKMPGGAPMNVAIHLTYNHFSPLVISRVGSDDLGQELLDFLKEKQVSTRYIQVGQTHLTGVVKANISNKNEVSYKIVEPVAWDYIMFDEEVAALVEKSDVFIYGSLAARNPGSQETLLKYLPLAKLRVFDVNLRPPYYNQERVGLLLQFADIVKMNHQELAEIVAWFNLEAGGEREQMQAVKDQFGLQLVIVTRGENGAAVLSDEGYFEHPGYHVEVADTIGSGDAFLATFLTSYLQHQPMPEALKKACAVGAYVASQPGATPTYNPADPEKLLTENKTQQA
ncbi:MAG: carbohydrate kinase family protein [Adhaeribacter sp.]